MSKMPTTLTMNIYQYTHISTLPFDNRHNSRWTLQLLLLLVNTNKLNAYWNEQNDPPALSNKVDILSNPLHTAIYFLLAFGNAFVIATSNNGSPYSTSLLFTLLRFPQRLHCDRHCPSCSGASFVPNVVITDDNSMAWITLALRQRTNRKQASFVVAQELETCSSPKWVHGFRAMTFHVSMFTIHVFKASYSHFFGGFS